MTRGFSAIWRQMDFSFPLRASSMATDSLRSTMQSLASLVLSAFGSMGAMLDVFLEELVEKDKKKVGCETAQDWTRIKCSSRSSLYQHSLPAHPLGSVQHTPDL